MKNKSLIKKLLALFVVLITSINAASAYTYTPSGVEQQTMQSQQIVTTGGAYTGTVYEPFSETTPSEQSAVGASQAPAKAPSGPRKGRTPGEATSGTDLSPIGEPWVMVLFALGFIGIIFIRKRNINQTTDMKSSTKHIAILALFLTLGVGNAWADRKLYLRPDGGFADAGAKFAVYYAQDGGSLTGWTDWMTPVPGTSNAIYETTIPDAVNHVVFVRYSCDATTVPKTWSGSLFWNQTYDQTSLNSNHIFYVVTSIDGSSKGVGYWTASSKVFAPGTTVYYDNTNTGWTTPNLRIGHGSWTNAYTMTLVTGTKNLYKYTITSKWENYTGFAITDNCGGTNNSSNTPAYDFYNSKGSDKYEIKNSTTNLTENVLSPFFTIIATSKGSTGTYGQYYNIDKYGEKKTWTITCSSVDHAEVVLYYWDENNVMQTVTEGNSAQVLPTTKVWCRVRPDAGYSLKKVNLYDPTEREWTDASREDGGFEKNCYVVRTNVTFTAVIEPYATMTILVKDVNSWAPDHMYIKGWNPFLYEGYDNAQYHYTTQKVTNKITLSCGDYYVITISNEFPFYYIHNESDAQRTAFFATNRLTHMAKYDDYTSGDGDWGLKTAACGDAIYWVETYKGSGPKYISNIVSNTTDTMSFYVESGATVEFHAGASSPVNQYSTVFAKYFASEAQLDGKAGGVFTATSNAGGTGLAHDTIFDGDYHIHVNANTRNYLNAGGVSKDGTTGTRFIKFEKSSLFNDTYDHYWVDWFLGSGDGQGAQSVVASVGNKYNVNLAGILGADAFAPKGMTQTAGGNVRYGYDPETNFFERAIVASGNAAVKITSNSAATDNDSVMISTNNGSTYTDNATTARFFKDATNWNYQVYAQVRGGSHATVTTSYVAGTQTLANQKKLIGGAGATQYNVIITYDFKTNRLIAAWNPDPVAGFEGFDLYSNLMAIRTENGAPTVLNMHRETVDKCKKTLNEITKIYTVMEFLQDNWKDDATKPYANRRIDADSWCDEYYWIALPYDCYVGDIFGIEGYGSGDDDSWVLQRYRGDLRAQLGWWAETETWWEDMTRTDTLKAGQGYVLRVTNLNGDHGKTKRFAGESGGKLYLYFPSMKSGLSLGLVLDGDNLATSMTSTVPAHTCDKWRGKDDKPQTNEGNPRYDRRAIDSNWNIIGSPSFNSTKITSPTWGDEYPTSNVKGELKFFYTWAANTDPKYTVKTSSSFSSFEFKATHAYLVQYAGDITWIPYNSSNPLVELKAPKRTNDENGDQTLQLVLMQDTVQADVTYISRMAEGATEGYDLNMDLSKLTSATGNNLYTIAGYYKMAGNCLPDTTSIVPVGVMIAQDGEYTFAMPEGTNGVGVVLVDEVANTRTNLALTDYTVNLAAGTYDGRFMLELSPIAQTPTDVEHTSADGMNGVRKVMVDGILYIVKDGQVFDARGNRIQ